MVTLGVVGVDTSGAAAVGAVGVTDAGAGSGGGTDGVRGAGLFTAGPGLFGVGFVGWVGFVGGWQLFLP